VSAAKLVRQSSAFREIPLRALISDIHGNLEALEAVLSDIRGRGITEIYCLGDVVGYGPNPAECIDLVMGLDMCLLGNHDQAALFDPVGFNAAAERSIFWTRSVLERSSGLRAEKRWDFLGELNRRHRDEESKTLYVHGSARNPLNEYVFPDDIYNQVKMEKIFALIEKTCFQGHTHIPGVFTDTLNFLEPEQIGFKYRLGAGKVMINVGSVGQPRNNDPRSSYVTVSGDTVEFHRVPYDVEKTIAKIYAIPELDNFLGDRLRDGR
jgi:predicted phosphodiesterase